MKHRRRPCDQHGDNSVSKYVDINTREINVNNTWSHITASQFYPKWVGWGQWGAGALTGYKVLEISELLTMGLESPGHSASPYSCPAQLPPPEQLRPYPHPYEVLRLTLRKATPRNFPGAHHKGALPSFFQDIICLCISASELSGSPCSLALTISIKHPLSHGAWEVISYQSMPEVSNI